MSAFPKTCFLLLIGLLFYARGGQTQVYYVDLAAQPLGLATANFTVEQVLDGRAGRAGIGTVHRGLHNISQVASLKPDVGTALTTYLQAQLPRPATPAPALVLVVRQLQLAEEITTFYEKASIDLAVDAYVHLPDGYHYALNAADYVEGKGMETTARHPRHLAQALQHCLTQCQSINWAKAAGQPARTLEYLQQVGRPAGGAPSYPILTDSVRRRGYFPNFLAFRNNQPVEQPALLVETRPRTAKGWEGTLAVNPYTATAGGGKDYLRKVWGFTDGKQLYILHNKRFVPLVRQGSTFGFVGFSGADPGAVATAAVLGGAIGGAIAAGATDDQPTDYTLNMVTGRISQFADPGMPALADTAMLYVYRRAGGPPVQVLLNDKPVGELGDNQLLALPWTDKEHEPRLCLGPAPGKCLSFLPTFGQAAYFKVSRNPADAAKPPLEQVPEKEGLFDLKLIRAWNRGQE
jgi:hypothetical protein